MTRVLSYIADELKQTIIYINNYYPLVACIVFVLPTFYLKELFLSNDVHYITYLSITMAGFVWFVGVTWSSVSKDDRAIANMIYSLTQASVLVIFSVITKPNNEPYLFNGELHGVNFNLLIFPLIMIWLLITVCSGRFIENLDKPS